MVVVVVLGADGIIMILQLAQGFGVLSSKLKVYESSRNTIFCFAK